MPSDDNDRAERLARLRAIAADERKDFPTLDEGALTTMLANLDESEKRSSKWRRLGWVAIGVVAALVVVAILWGMR
ncbi:hypothetical protein VARIO8X_90416 [Burkholderiales bacterium 8X]|nr:hypothetical protein VARIO8X_90416 [Burkholderiales bacterium 8X]